MHTRNKFNVAGSIRRGGMKTSAFGTRDIGRSGAERLLVALATVVGIAAAGCDEGHEGDRCVAALSHNDCASSDLTCTQPPNCPETYCCSANSTHPNCLPGCSGGGLSIAFAMVGGTCSSSTPDPLCACLNIVGG